VLIFKEVLCNLNNSFQNLLVNVGSLSETIEVGMPCNLKILDTNS
jgi:hypothetical protein